MQNQECQWDFPIGSHQLDWKSGRRMIHAVGRFSQASFTRGWKLSLARVTVGSRSRLSGVKYLNRGREATETHARPPTTNETFRQFVKGNIYLFSTALISRMDFDRVLHKRRSWIIAAQAIIRFIDYTSIDIVWLYFCDHVRERGCATRCKFASRGTSVDTCADTLCAPNLVGVVDGKFLEIDWLIDKHVWNEIYHWS